MAVTNPVQENITMSKKSPARSQFDTRATYICNLFDAEWVSLPSIDLPQPKLAVKLVFGVQYKVTEQDHAGWVGREAVIYLWAGPDRRPVSSKEKELANTLQLNLAAGATRILKEDKWLKCKFGEPDPTFSYQNMVDYWSATDEEVRRTALSAWEQRTEPRPFGLEFDQKERIVRREGHDDLDLGGNSILWMLFDRLASAGSHRYSVEDLRQHLWEDPSTDPHNVHVQKQALAKKISVLGLRIDSKPGLGYKLEEA
jgi:hypothetical protein